MGVALRQIIGRLPAADATLVFLDGTGQEVRRSYRNLHDDVAVLASHLERSGVRRGCRVGILGPSSYSWMVWDLACIALDCVCVAFGQEKAREPLQSLVEGYALHLIAVDPAWTSAPQLEAPYAVAIESTVIPADKHAVERPLPRHAPGTHSLVFSSGTTGTTKGLIISAPGTERLLTLYAEAFGVCAGDRFLTFLPFANYQQRMAYYFCLYHGIDFVYVPYQALFASLKKHQPTYIIAPPVFYESVQNLARSLASAPANGNAATTAQRLAALLGGNIRYLITGMAPIKQATLEFFWDNGLQLFEAFGITEAGMVTWNKPGCVRLGTVGKPAEPGSVRLTPEGEVIVTRDALLSLGYFEASEEDRRATFVAAQSVATGDIAQWDADGFLTIVGRKKDAIVTKSGEKFHPEPIEALIQRDPRVKSAVVTECSRLPGTVAIVALNGEDTPEVRGEIERAVWEMNCSLPLYQQVKRIVFTRQDFSIENGLRTKNLKLDRKAIRAAFLERPAAAPGG